MRNGYNKELGFKIIKEREERALETRFDHNGNVIRDYREETRILSESETNNILPEVPIIVFDGCRTFQTHIQNTNIQPVVRTIKLASLGEPKKQSTAKIIFNFTNRVLGHFILFRKNKLPIYNSNDKNNVKAYAIGMSMAKQPRSFER
ncbi:MAG TPA: hypothetical protein PJ987_09540 [Bacteroidia bacterium]|nr:hypothetical protein [Bacteroidia bacterium]HMY42179.1 hypothetical protein [Chitinophagales bacterium]